jgi:flavorubredoxin
MLCPQHGAIYRGDDVMRFIDWFEGLEVAVLRKKG